MAEIEWYPKPAERTPRGVKNCVIAAMVAYIAAGLCVIAALANSDAGWIGPGIGFGLLGLLIQHVVARVVRWYLIG